MSLHREAPLHFFGALAVALAAVALAGCDSENAAELASRSVAVQAESQTAPGNPVDVFGPAQIVRATGAPVDQEFTFLHPAMVREPFELVVQNGDPNGENRISSAQVRLNGANIIRPSDLNQGVSELRVPIALETNNNLSVTLQGKPGGWILLSIQGQLAQDQVTGETSVTLDTSGGTIDLGGATELLVPPGAFDGPTDIVVTALSSEVFDFFASTEVPSFQALPIPKVRIKSSRRPQAPLSLIVRGIDPTSIPTDRDVGFVAAFEDSGLVGEGLTDFATIGGTDCEEAQAACVEMLPGWFSATNPLDPADPVATVGVGTQPSAASQSHGLWRLTQVVPDENSLLVSRSDTISVGARFELHKDFSLAAGAPLESIQYAGHFYRQNGNLHGGVDLLAVNGTPVFAVLNGNAANVGFSAFQGKPPDLGFTCPGGVTVYGSYGNRITLSHPPDFETRYAHLQSFLIAANVGVTTPAEIALSDNTGRSCGPHLHFETRLNGARVDPEPLLADDLALYLNDPSHPTTLRIDADAVPLTTRHDVVTTDFNFSDSVSFSQLQVGRRYQMALKLAGERLGGEHKLKTWRVSLGYRLTVASTGGGGTITSASGIDCGADCTEVLNPQSQVTLTATPSSNATFVGWSGDCQGTTPSITFSMTSDRGCTAEFAGTTGPCTPQNPNGTCNSPLVCNLGQCTCGPSQCSGGLLCEPGNGCRVISCAEAAACPTTPGFEVTCCSNWTCRTNVGPGGCQSECSYGSGCAGTLDGCNQFGPWAICH